MIPHTEHVDVNVEHVEHVENLNTCEFFIKRLGRTCKNKKKIEGLCKLHHRLSPNIQPLRDLLPLPELTLCEETCVVCTEDIKERLPCNHYIHKECVIKSGKNLCPLCRSKISLTEEEEKECEKYNKELRHYIENSDDLIDQYDLTLHILIEFIDQLEHEDLDPSNILDYVNILFSQFLTNDELSSDIED